MKQKPFYAAVLFLLVPLMLLGAQPLEEKTNSRAKNLALREIYKELGTEQKENIDTLREAFSKDMEMLKTDMQIAKLELQKLLMKDDVTKEEVRAQLEVIADISTDIRMAQYSLEIDIKAEMTEEQKAQYEKLRIRIARKIEKEVTKRQNDKRQRKDDSRPDKRRR